MIPPKRTSSLVVSLFVLSLFVAPVALAAGGAGYQTRQLGWITLGSLFWSSLMLDWPGIRALLQRSWLFTLIPAVIMTSLLPILMFGIPFFGWLVGMDFGKTPGISSEGITLSITSALQLFSPLYFLFCGTVAICLAFMKILFLRAFASDQPRIAGMLAVMVMGTLSTLLFVGGVVFDQKRAIASVQTYVMGQVMGQSATAQKSQPQGGGKSANPMENLTAPLTDYYKNLGKTMNETRK